MTSRSIQKILETNNVAELLSEEELTSLGASVIDGATIDENSRQEWTDKMHKSIEMLKNKVTSKAEPWQGAEKINYPVTLNAAVQFNARTNPEIIQGDKVVYFDIMNGDKTHDTENRCRRLGAHMSYQLLALNNHWRTDTDKLTILVAILGTVFRKVYWDNDKQIPMSDLCLPDDIIIHNDEKSMEEAFRITHRIRLTRNQVKERMSKKIYLEYDFDKLDYDSQLAINQGELRTANTPTKSEQDKPVVSRQILELYEQQTYADLDGDGYQEPYLITVHRQSRKVFSIFKRFRNEDIERDGNKIISIKAFNHYNDYHFIPDPAGGFYSVGFGELLSPINYVINSSLEALLYSAQLQNLQSFLIAGGVKFTIDEVKLKMGGGYKVGVPSGSTLRDNFCELPTHEPSAVLMKLVEVMIEAAEKISSISDVMQGQNPGANTAATTVLTMVEQGTKVYSSILHRLLIYFQKEYQKIYDLNKQYLKTSQYFKTSIASGMIMPEDYSGDDYGVFPVANPNMSSDMQRMAQQQAIIQSMQIFPELDRREVAKQWLDTLHAKEPEKLLPEPDPNAPPPLSDQIQMAELAIKKMQAAEPMMKHELEAIRLELDHLRVVIQREEAASRIAASHVDSKVKEATFIHEAGLKELEQAAALVEQEEQKTEQELPNAPEITQQLGELSQQVFPQQQQGQQQDGQGQPEQQQGGEGQQGWGSLSDMMSDYANELQAGGGANSGGGGIPPQMAGAVSNIQGKINAAEQG